MLTVVTRTGIVSRLSCNLSSRTCTERIVLRLNGRGIQLGGYVKCNSTCAAPKKPRRTLLRFSVNSLNGTALSYSTEHALGRVQYEKICDETLDSLTEHFEELVEAAAHLPDADVAYGDGVLTVKFGEPHGTYVINRQTPNKQIWLSSPKSGPKRYDFINGQWIYKHDGKSLHELLNNEIPAIVKDQVCFDKCSFSGREKRAVMDGLFPDK